MKTIKNLKAEEIRKSILQLAIQGKLVKQDSNDEPASELVKRIYAEKQKLIQEGKIKKDMNESFIFKGDDNCYYEKIGNNNPIKLDDLPFDIPDNWIWIRQKNICWLDNGVKAKGEKLPYLEAKVIRGKQSPSMVESGVIVDSNNKVILVDGENSGEIMTPPYKGYMGSTFKIFSATPLFNYSYLIEIFKLNKEKYKNSKVGAAIPHLNKELFKEFLIAVPPFDEQQRIVKKINFFEQLIKEYDHNEKQLTELESSFADKLKKSILQYAIEGKLVKQDPNDEPASVLLERIKNEKEQLIKEGKIKRDKNESYIFQGDDKNYYENLPQGWCICTLNNLATYKKGPFGSSLTKGMFVSESTPNRVKVYEQKNAIQHDEKIGSYFISENKFKEMQSFEVNPLDFIVSCAGTIGEIFKLPLNASKGIINQALMKVTLINESISDYFEIIFYDALHKLSEKSKGTAIKNIAPFEILKPALIQLPPLDEQQRILEKLNIIATLIDC